MELLEKVRNFFNKDNIGEPPWEYKFLFNLPESEYPKYLKKIFRYKMGYDLNLTKPKTFNEKIQWLKLYDATPLKRDCTDKVKVRDYVKEKIGTEYLKPVSQICNSFDEIDFEKLPDSFIMKCNHGCKWHFIIPDKKIFLSDSTRYKDAKKQMTGWLEQEFWPWEGFEMQYKGIEPKVLIEELLCENFRVPQPQIKIYLSCQKPKYIVKYNEPNELCAYDENLNYAENIINSIPRQIKIPVDDLLLKSIELSKKLASDFNFVRADWMLYKDKLYFEELTFTPFSGFLKLKNHDFDKKLGNWVII